jgi:hypothetical protein
MTALRIFAFVNVVIVLGCVVSIAHITLGKPKPKPKEKMNKPNCGNCHHAHPEGCELILCRYNPRNPEPREAGDLSWRTARDMHRAGIKIEFRVPYDFAEWSLVEHLFDGAEVPDCAKVCQFRVKPEPKPELAPLPVGVGLTLDEVEQAFAEGRELQYLSAHDGTWQDRALSYTIPCPDYTYRIKPEPEPKPEPKPEPLLIYIASPYTKGDVAVNVRAQLEAAHRIMDAGHAPVTPLLRHFLHIHRARPYEDWTRLDNAIIPRVDALLRLPGESKGADDEVKLARCYGIVVLNDWKEFDEWRANGCPRMTIACRQIGSF